MLSLGTTVMLETSHVPAEMVEQNIVCINPSLKCICQQTCPMGFCWKHAKIMLKSWAHTFPSKWLSTIDVKAIQMRCWHIFDRIHAKLPCLNRGAMSVVPRKSLKKFRHQNQKTGFIFDIVKIVKGKHWDIVPLAADNCLSSILHAPSAPSITVAKHRPIVEIDLPSNFCSEWLSEKVVNELWEWFRVVNLDFFKTVETTSVL